MNEIDAQIDTISLKVDKVESAASISRAGFAGEVNEFGQRATNLEAKLDQRAEGTRTAQATNINSDMADHISVVGQSDVFVFPVNIFAPDAVSIVHFVDDEGAFHIDLDRRRIWRGPWWSTRNFALHHGRCVVDINISWHPF